VKERGRLQAGTYEYWFRREYNLAPTDPRYLDASHDEILAEYWTRHFDDIRQGLKAEEEIFEDDDFNVEEVCKAMDDHPDDWESVI